MKQVYNIYAFSLLMILSLCVNMAQAQTNAADLLKQAKAKHIAKDYKAAIALFDQAIKLDNKSKEVYYHRGMAYFKLHEFQDAVADFDRAIKLDAKYADAYVGKALVKYEAGDTQGACEDIKKAGELGFAESSEYIKKYCR